jgi:hypothetical protein
MRRSRAEIAAPSQGTSIFVLGADSAASFGPPRLSIDDRRSAERLIPMFR